MHFHWGADSYGRVKVVGRTAIVTRFFAVNSLPIYPLQSFYLWTAADAGQSGLPFAPGTEGLTTLAIPLARRSRVSVAMSYLRGFLAILAIIGFLGLLMWLFDAIREAPQMDEVGRQAAQILSLVFVIGAAIGLLTYAIPMTSRRERRIRTYCGDLLRICADPACVSEDFAQAMAEFASAASVPDDRDDSRRQVRCELVEVRARLRRGDGDVRTLEQETDRLLARLDQLDRQLA